ncbi:Uncharacterized protein HZ326_29664 [Fusarium oxysporum f. sp. albedinis]|nr:Uncharacterized protein HZ326_29664 [Fusarium oxysporum f. sp. albedinis]
MNRRNQREIGSLPKVGIAKLPNFWWLMHQVIMHNLSHTNPCFFPPPSLLSHFWRKDERKRLYSRREMTATDEDEFMLRPATVHSGEQHMNDGTSRRLRGESFSTSLSGKHRNEICFGRETPRKAGLRPTSGLATPLFAVPLEIPLIEAIFKAQRGKCLLLQALVRQAYQSLSLHAAEDAISTNNSSKGGTFSSEHKTRVRFWTAMVDGSAYENRKGPCLERIEGSDSLDSHPRADAIQGRA